MTKTFWLSFCDDDKPIGQQFLGACVVDVTEEDAAETAAFIADHFPRAQDGSEWVGAAARKAHTLGCNPGGQVLSLELSHDHPMLTRYTKGVLLDRATIERIDAEIVDNNPDSV